MIGKIAKCMRGIVGIITSKESTVVSRDYDYETDSYNYEYEDLYKGVKLDGTPWQSKKPTIICNSISEYVRNNIEDFLPLAEPKEIFK